MANNFTAVRAHYFNGGNLPGLLTEIEIRGAIDVNAAFRQIDSALGIVRKAREELISYLDYLVRLLGQLSNFSPQLNILAIVILAAKRVAGC